MVLRNPRAGRHSGAASWAVAETNPNGGGHFSGTPMNLQYVIRNKQAIGFLLSAGARGYRAFDQNGRPIGLFDNEELAAKAVYEQQLTETD